MVHVFQYVVPFSLVLLSHLSMLLVFFLLSWMAGLAGSPFSTAFSWVLAKPMKLIWSCILFAVDQYQFIADVREFIELSIRILGPYGALLLWENPGCCHADGDALQEATLLAASSACHTHLEIRCQIPCELLDTKKTDIVPLHNLAISSALAAVNFVLAALNSTPEECLRQQYQHIPYSDMVLLS